MAIINPGDVPINEGQVDGTELARRLERLYAVVHSQNSSASRPPAITPGGIWSKTVTGGFDVMVYDGTQDVKIGSVINGTPNFTVGALLTTGGTMSGEIDMGNSKITNIDTPTEAGDALAWGKPASVTDLTATGALNANGGLNTTGVATFSAGTAAAPAITTTGDTNTGIFFPAADTIAFAEGGVEQMRLNSAGDLQMNSGYGSVATAYGCRAWVNFNGTGTPAIRASGNVTSITDNGTGDYTVNFTSAMPDVNYSMGQSLTSTGTNFVRYLGIFSKTTSSVRIQSIFAGATTAGFFDYEENNVQIFR
jgi:hypothetical protein